ncbi:hypothetical protein KEM48_006696, partial [Puccinia striiformis f. sp. tritici PST-130]
MPESTAPPSDGITDPNTVRPSADPREWPSDEQDTITPEKTPAQRTQSGTRTHTKAQTKKRQRDSLGLAHSHDHNQESNQENFKAKKSKSDRSKKPNEFGIDDIDDYFYPPIYGEGETEADGDPMYYECRWCRKVYKKGEGTRGNLVKHRDGDKHRTPCPRRTDAILAGANLPLTAKEIAAKKPEEENGVTLKSAAQDGKFDPKVFKQLILIWLIRNSLSWTHIDNPLLLSAFGYARADFKLYNSGAWAASETNKLHINLQGQIIRKLNVRSTPFIIAPFIVDRYEDVELSDRFEENDGAENQQSEDEESQPRGLTSVNGGSKVAAASRIQGSQQSSVNKI